MKYIKKNKIYIINLLFSVGIFLFILIFNKISPFGDKMLGYSDAPLQFKPMLYSLMMKIKTGILLNYSFNNGLGNAIIFDFLYYISSPLNFIAIFFKSPDAMYLSATVIKILVASLCMTFYVKKKTDNNYVNFIATLSYIYSSWFLAYYYYLPWLDIFMIFPLFQYGLEKLLDQHKYHIYIFSIAYMMAANLYLCFSVCIYTIIFFILYELLYKKEPFRKKLLTFDYIALSTIGSFLLAFFYLYGWYDSMIKIKIGFNQTYSTGYSIPILDFLKSLYYSNISFIYLMEGKTFPNIACPTIILISFIYYFINSKKRKEKVFLLLGVIISVLIIFVPQLDFIMNAFHHIRGLTYRYSFIFIFLMIWFFIANYKENKEINKKKLLLITFIIFIGCLLLSKNMEPRFLVTNIIFILCYLVLIIFYENNKVYKYLSLIVFALQIIFVTNMYIPNKYSIETPDSIKFNTNPVTYRINNNQETKGNETEVFNNYFNNMSTHVYSSMTYSKVVYLYNYLGLITFENTYGVIYDSNTIQSLLLNVKSTKNDYYLEKIYAVNKELENVMLVDGNVKYNIETVIEGMTGIKDIHEKKILKGIKSGKDYRFNTEYEYYLIELNSEDDGEYNIGQFYKQFTQDIKYGKGIATIYIVKDNKLKDIYNYLKKNQIKYSYYRDNHMKGTINVDKDQIIFTSIPYDKDWVVKVDGKIVKPIELLDSLMGIKVKEGKHTIELEYKTHYLIPALISITSLIVLIIDYIRKRIKQKA